MLKRYKKLYPCSFYNILRQFCFDQALHLQNAMRLDVFWQISKNLFVYHTRESYCSAGFGLLGVDLEVKSLCFWPTPQTGILRIEECIYITHGRRLIGPPDVIRIVLISYNVVFLGVANQPPCLALQGALNAISKRVNPPTAANFFSRIFS